MRESCADAMALSAVQVLWENYHSVIIPFLPPLTRGIFPFTESLTESNDKESAPGFGVVVSLPRYREHGALLPVTEHPAATTNKGDDCFESTGHE